MTKELKDLVIDLIESQKEEDPDKIQGSLQVLEELSKEEEKARELVKRGSIPQLFKICNWKTSPSLRAINCLINIFNFYPESVILCLEVQKILSLLTSSKITKRETVNFLRQVLIFIHNLMKKSGAIFEKSRKLLMDIDFQDLQQKWDNCTYQNPSQEELREFRRERVNLLMMVIEANQLQTVKWLWEFINQQFILHQNFDWKMNWYILEHCFESIERYFHLLPLADLLKNFRYVCKPIRGSVDSSKVSLKCFETVLKIIQTCLNIDDFWPTIFENGQVFAVEILDLFCFIIETTLTVQISFSLVDPIYSIIESILSQWQSQNPVDFESSHFSMLPHFQTFFQKLFEEQDNSVVVNGNIKRKYREVCRKLRAIENKSCQNQLKQLRNSPDEATATLAHRVLNFFYFNNLN